MEDLLIRRRIIQRDRGQVERDALGCFDQLERVVDDRKRGQAQEVHLQQAHLLIDFMSYAVTMASSLVRVTGTSSVSGLGAITTPAAWTRAAHQPFQPHCGVDQLADLRVFIRRGQRRRVFQRLLDRDPNRRWNQFRDSVHLAVRHVQRAPNVLDRRLRRHGVEGDDLRHLVLAVLLLHVLDHLAAPVHAEVDVDVRHVDALRVQEALEKKLVLQRVDVGDLHAVRHQRSGGRAAPRPDGNRLLARVADKVPHNHEIAGILHLLDAGNLTFHPGPVLRNVFFSRPPARRCSIDVASRFSSPLRHTFSK